MAHVRAELFDPPDPLFLFVFVNRSILGSYASLSCVLLDISGGDQSVTRMPMI